MGLARDLVEAEDRLREATAIDLFAPLETGGLLSAPDYAGLISRVTARDAGAILRLCLQCLRIQHDEMSPRLVDAELVATLPPDTTGIARQTERVVREMITAATQEIVLLGYEFTDLDLVTLLGEAAARGTDVIVICDRGRGSARRVLDAWRPGARLPRIFHDRARTDSAPYASMHAKCLLVDGRNLLVTSANFTFHGLHGNIEIGIRISGAPAYEARKIFSHLVETRVLEEASA
jgi:phosphatidylserine/phosphatidylglycerophosphate/cardiolipin synthase-like enzyme